MALAIPAPAAADDGPVNDPISEIVVTGLRRDTPLEDFIGNIDRIGAESIDEVRHQHIRELMTRVFGSRFNVGLGLRAEYVRYDYDNRMLDGNTRDDGTVCGFGGCLYTRPADRSDEFTNPAPKFSAG